MVDEADSAQREHDFVLSRVERLSGLVVALKGLPEKTPKQKHYLDKWRRRLQRKLHVLERKQPVVRHHRGKRRMRSESFSMSMASDTTSGSNTQTNEH